MCIDLIELNKDIYTVVLILINISVFWLRNGKHVTWVCTRDIMHIRS